MTDFLLWVGSYNLLGAGLLMAMHHDRVADFVLRRATEIVSVPFVHGAWSRMWLWWAAAVNLFLGAVMVRAGRWPVEVQREVVLGAVVVYVVMYVVLAWGGRGPRFGRGVWVTHALWLAQIGWGAWTLRG